MHWSDDFLGMEYDADSFDCATFAIEGGNAAGHQITLPTYTLKTGGDDNRHQLINEFKFDYAKPVDHPIDGHPVLFIIEGKPKHIGLCAKIYDEWYIVHNVEKMGVVRQPMRTMEEKIEGFYQWLT